MRLASALALACLIPIAFDGCRKSEYGFVQEKLNEQGFALVAANRFLSGLRSVISLTVGMAHYGHVSNMVLE